MILIDEEFKNLIPPLSDEEFKQLEENCLRDGVRDPLVVWSQEDGHDILIDGHNRWSIVRKHGGLPFDIKRMEFEDRDEAKVWIIDNQLGQRNLNTYNMLLLQDKKNEILAERARHNRGGDRKSEEFQKSNPKKSWELNEDEKRASRKKNRENETDYKIAKAAGASEDTLRKVRVIEEQGSDLLKQQARAGEISINKAYRVARGYEDKSPAQAQKEYLNEVQARHDDFTERSKEGVVSVAELKADKDDRQVLAREFYTRCLRMGERIDALVVDIKEGEIEPRDLSAVLSPADRLRLRSRCDELIKGLFQIKGVIKN